MCGLTGFWNFKHRWPKEQLLDVVTKMAARIERRGPDSEGAWSDEEIGLALGHRRLAIVDLSPAGHQPMISQSQRFVLIYNGEIYNSVELRTELVKEGCSFRGYSDTEVILEASERWGVQQTCQRLIGMFAFACWDRKTQRLYLTRDRLGIKPLYWGFNQGVFFFGSQLKSFTAHPEWRPSLDLNALSSYFRFNYVPTPLSIFQGINKLAPGMVLSLDSTQKIEQNSFWDLQTVISQGREKRANEPDAVLVNELDQLLHDAVKRRMVADVPLGAFLSGGIDSSTVVALMQAESPRPIQTFSIGFHEADYDEAQYAASVAHYLKTDHHELYLSAQDALDVVPNIPDWCDEPFADVSQIPTFLVSRLARKSVTVSLSGDGGDELFAGYNRYFLGQAIWRKLKLCPHWLRHLGAKGIQQLAPAQWDLLAKMVPKRFRPRLVGDKAYKLANILECSTAADFYKMLVSQWETPDALVLGAKEPTLYPWGLKELGSDLDAFVESMQRMDTLTYLPDDILAKVDRASMAVSLEARVPLLDHRVVEFSWTLPMNLKIREGQGKWILRQVLNRYVPAELINRPKMGFGVPIDQWLRGPLREWGESLLSLERLTREGLLNAPLVRQRWEEHLSGKRNWQYPLWGVLMFEAWYERWMSGS